MIQKFICMTFILLITAFSPIAVSAAGEDVGSLQKQIDSLKKDFSDMKSFYEQRIQDLEQQVNELKATGPAETERAAEAAPEFFTSVPSPVSPGGISQTTNPDISVVGDFLGIIDQDGNKEFNMHEVELGFQGRVDPFAKADFFIGMHNEEGELHTHVEEGYITLLEPPDFLRLPSSAQLKIGKFKAAMGKSNRQHQHYLPYIDRPAVTENFLGEEGLAESGVSLSTLIPNPSNRFINLEMEVLNGFSEEHHEEGGGEGASSRTMKDWLYLAHITDFHEFNDNTTLEAGFSAATARCPISHRRTSIESFDFTYRWKPLEASDYKSFWWMTEFFLAQKDGETSGENHAFGLYSAATHQISRKTFLGLRYDYSEYPDNPSNRDSGYSAFVNFFQSEFARYTLQYKHIDKNYAEDDDTIMFQLNFNIGPHGAHPY
ncbi:MAG: hypothetical protein ABIH23_20955 [bacterium]